jgi:uncharacterized small protein (DUF1192 family)
MEPGPPIGQDDFMINPEDDLPKPVRKLLVPPPLDMLGIDELSEYIALLQAEIERVRVKGCGKGRRRGIFQDPARLNAGRIPASTVFRVINK